MMMKEPVADGHPFWKEKIPYSQENTLFLCESTLFI